MNKNKKILTAGIWLYGLSCVASNQPTENKNVENVQNTTPPAIIDNGFKKMNFKGTGSVIGTVEPTVVSTIESTKEPKATEKPKSTKKPKVTEKPNKKSSATKSPSKTKSSTTSNITTTKLYNSIPLSARFQKHIDEKCKSYGLSTNVVMGVLKKESSFQTQIMGDRGEAYGLMQVQKKWHRARMRKVGATDLLNPYDNVNVGIDYLAELYRANNKNWHKTLMAYNGGQAYANRRTSTYYSRTVMQYAESFKKERND